MKLFISYAHLDRKSTEALTEILRRGGYEPWIDDRLLTGKEWQQQLLQAIMNADAVVLVISPNWLGSHYCNWEFVTASRLNKLIIPVLIQYVDRTQVPERIQQTQWADFTDGFGDEVRVRKFLNDVLELEAQGVSSELSRKPVDMISQDIIANRIENSTVTLAGTYITNPPVQTRKATVIAGVGIICVFLMALILAMIPESERSQFLTRTGLLEPSPVPQPTRLPAGRFSVVVAGFGFRQLDGTITQDVRADDIGDIVYGSLSEMREIDYLLSWRNPGVGHILAEDAASREEQAAEIANQLGADVVIYGLVSADNLFDIFEPVFYVTAEFVEVEPELVGATTFGAPIEVLRQSKDQALSAVLDFQRRMRIMRLFVRGLAMYIGGDFSAAQEAFEEAVSIEDDGLEVLYIFAGNAAGRQGRLGDALAFYDSALLQRPGYARALIGKGMTLYADITRMADSELPAYDPDLRIPDSQRCAKPGLPSPDSPQAQALLALRCYAEAASASDQSDNADVDVKVAFGRGQVYLWLSVVGYGSYWETASKALQEITEIYMLATPTKQLRIRAMAAQASAWQGTILLSTQPAKIEAVTQAQDYYRQAVTLLQNDMNRAYNREWVDLYQQQADALQEWLDERGVVQ